jgi:hypothetical protein
VMDSETKNRTNCFLAADGSLRKFLRDGFIAISWRASPTSTRWTSAFEKSQTREDVEHVQPHPAVAV